MPLHCDPPDDGVLRQRAATIAARFGLPLEPGVGGGLCLVLTRDGLELRDDVRGAKPVRIDLTRLDTTSPAGRSRRQPLARAIGPRRGGDMPRVLDATAGLGEDAWLLAAWGCAVLCCERQPMIAAMLDDAIARAAAMMPDVASRLTVVTGDARQADLGRLPPFDVIYLDPMFPAGRKTLERRPLRLLRLLAGDDADADELLAWALHTAARRVVVKRPRKAPFLAGREPMVAHAGKAVRWDVYTAVQR